jgi:hypothetical protein
LVRVCNLLDHIFTKDEIVSACFRVSELVRNEAIGNSVLEVVEEISEAATIATLAASSS